MRYAERIEFVKEVSGGGYNPDTGVHDEETVIRESKPCNISPLGIDRTRQLFGALDKEILIVRLQRPYLGKCDYALVNGKKYAITQHVPHRSESVFYLEGMA